MIGAGEPIVRDGWKAVLAGVVLFGTGFLMFDEIGVNDEIGTATGACTAGETVFAIGAGGGGAIRVVIDGRGVRFWIACGANAGFVAGSGIDENVGGFVMTTGGSTEGRTFMLGAGGPGIGAGVAQGAGAATGIGTACAASKSIFGVGAIFANGGDTTTTATAGSRFSIKPLVASFHVNEHSVQNCVFFPSTADQPAGSSAFTACHLSPALSVATGPAEEAGVFGSHRRRVCGETGAVFLQREQIASGTSMVICMTTSVPRHRRETRKRVW